MSTTLCLEGGTQNLTQVKKDVHRAGQQLCIGLAVQILFVRIFKNLLLAFHSLKPAGCMLDMLS